MIKKIIVDNKNKLPLISKYWDIKIAKEEHTNDKNEYAGKTVSLLHNTSKYTPYTFYKPISTTIDLKKYE